MSSFDHQKCNHTKVEFGTKWWSRFYLQIFTNKIISKRFRNSRVRKLIKTAKCTMLFLLFGQLLGIWLMDRFLHMLREARVNWRIARRFRRWAELDLPGSKGFVFRLFFRRRVVLRALVHDLDQIVFASVVAFRRDRWLQWRGWLLFGARTLSDQLDVRVQLLLILVKILHQIVFLFFFDLLIEVLVHEAVRAIHLRPDLAHRRRYGGQDLIRIMSRKRLFRFEWTFVAFLPLTVSLGVRVICPGLIFVGRWRSLHRFGSRSFAFLLLPSTKARTKEDLLENEPVEKVQVKR